MDVGQFRRENAELRLKLQAAMARIAELEGQPKTSSSTSSYVAPKENAKEKKVDHGHKVI